ncbi:MAG: transporter substrate-binding domain-containing protein [Steroidobacteraceae bacterium]
MTARVLAASLAVLTGSLGVGAAAAQGSAAPVARFENADADAMRVLQLANRRLALMPAVAAWKWLQHAPVTAPAREQVVIAHAGELAREYGLSESAVERLFALQVRLAREEESRLDARWHAGGYDYRGSPPSLQQVLRPQLDRLTGDLLQALYLAAADLSRQGFQSRYSARAALALQAPGWSHASRGELLTDLHAIGVPAGPALDRIRASGIVRIGTTGDYAPFSLDAGGRLSGADIELAGSLAAALGARAVFVQTSWPDLLGDLAAGRFDLAMGGISVTPARAAAAAFSTPYDSGGKTLLVRCADAGRFTSLAALDRPDVRLIVNPGGTNQDYVRGHVHHAHVRVFADNRAIFEQLLQHRADAMITDDVEVELQVHQHPGLCRGMPDTLTHEDKAILMPKDPELLAAVNGWLRAALARGQPAALIRAYSGSPGAR